MTLGAVVPPDVRKGSAVPVRDHSAYFARLSLAKYRNSWLRKGKAFPHIQRRSRVK